MTFIEIVPPAAAMGPVKDMYQQIEQRVGYFPNWVAAFSLRPAVWQGWDLLVSSIRANLSIRRYELATLAAARALNSTYCSLAHGQVLAEKVFDSATVTTIMEDPEAAPLEPGERAMMAFVEKVVRKADSITRSDIEVLRSHGFKDADIFDVTAAAAARCFFSKLLDALGVQADARFNDLDPALRTSLTVGRPIADSRSEGAEKHFTG